MSTIRFNIENFVSKETILDLNSIVNCIVNCGNDHLIIDTSKYSGMDLSNFIELIREYHCSDSNKTLQIIQSYRGKENGLENN